DIIGRTAGLLVDLPVQTTARGWRLGARSGRDSGRAASYISADLDAIEEAAAGYCGPFKIQACGPWTLAASPELTRRVEPAPAPAARAAALPRGGAGGLPRLAPPPRTGLPPATPAPRPAGPGRPAVPAGSVPTARGFPRLPPVDDSIAADNLRAVLAPATA